MRRLLLATCLALPSLLAAPAWAAPEITMLESDDPALRLGRHQFPGGRVTEFTIGIGSAAHHRAGDPADIVYTLSDRGPNIACADAEAFTGQKPAEICAADPRGRIYPVPDYSPTLYGVQLLPGQRRFRVFEAIALKRPDGSPITGLTNPLPGRTEQPLDGQGRRLAFDPAAIDAEGLLRLPDGRFWVGEENGPSLVEVAADGRILRRIVPAGTEGEFAGAGYRIEPGLPAILARRQSNRGIESLAGTPDGATLYAILQNPLANPDAAAYRSARNTRLIRFDPAAGRVTGEWVYQLDAPQSFRNDPSDRQSDPRISEMAWLGPDRLLVLERTEKTTKLYEVRLDQGATDIAGSAWDDGTTRPSLEQLHDLAGSGVVPVSKRLVLDSADHPELPGKIEGIALLPGNTLMLINDDDFGIGGERTRIALVRGALEW
ncbi:esterase-like activity of phytase family protein [Pseudoroseomonas cervicalis]|uniref:esterase-like activity of phytase family protein n=1 Tax=Teichococcus cervicalis TaxID=204525 RepID=UPI0022F1A77F|nr:esterase-like activity of phytase family protein [Pseudoroseomonas cervicalis]WBV43342.1 esterase-like activity of phytase family protein [Pseudoroseomonas cervicalis]